MILSLADTEAFLLLVVLRRAEIQATETPAEAAACRALFEKLVDAVPADNLAERLEAAR